MASMGTLDGATRRRIIGKTTPREGSAGVPTPRERSSGLSPERRSAERGRKARVSRSRSRNREDTASVETSQMLEPRTLSGLFDQARSRTSLQPQTHASATQCFKSPRPLSAASAANIKDVVENAFQQSKERYLVSVNYIDDILEEAFRESKDASRTAVPAQVHGFINKRGATWKRMKSQLVDRHSKTYQGQPALKVLEKYLTKDGEVAKTPNKKGVAAEVNRRHIRLEDDAKTVQEDEGLIEDGWVSNPCLDVSNTHRGSGRGVGHRGQHHEAGELPSAFIAGGA